MLVLKCELDLEFKSPLAAAGLTGGNIVFFGYRARAGPQRFSSFLEAIS